MGKWTNSRVAPLWATFAVTALLAAPALASVPVTLDGLTDRIELAYQARDIAGLESVRVALLATARDPEATRAAYYAAYARFRQGMLAAAAEDDSASDYLEDCIEELRDYARMRPDDAEARALLSSCLGMSTRYHRLAMAKRGLEARKQMDAALELAPANPWVVLQDGLCEYSTPRMFGGDPAGGIAKLERATTLFAARIETGSRAAMWGAAEAWLQLAHMYRAVGRAADAARALERARELAPLRTGFVVASTT